MNPWRDDPQGDADFFKTVNRIDAALAGPQRRIIVRRRRGVRADILAVEIGLLLVAVGQLLALVSL